MNESKVLGLVHGDLDPLRHDWLQRRDRMAEVLYEVEDDRRVGLPPPEAQ